jgi:hypothetical protein
VLGLGMTAAAMRFMASQPEEDIAPETVLEALKEDAAAVPPALRDYVRQARKDAVAPEALRQALLDAGWDARDVEAALNEKNPFIG